MASDAVAVVGVGCRLPGGIVDLATASAALSSGEDLVGRVPADRWDAAELNRTPSGKPIANAGGFVHDVDRFDHELFRMSPREAASADPSQRLLLQCAWAAFEDASMPPESVVGTNTAVYVGMGLVDYARRTLGSEQLDRIDAHAGTGAFSSVAAGRIAYAFGLQGPAMSVHTACSSSLVSLHLALTALRNGETDLALAGGANLLLSPIPTAYFAELGALSPTGRCRTFDAKADGYVRSEGVGLFLLKRQADAERDGDRILALIHGSAVNQDGRSNGLTAPSRAAQVAVMQAALRDAGAHPGAVGAIEAHGTGTPLGDPIEMAALSEVYGRGKEPCLVSSVKTHMGHLEAAAGFAGVLSAVVAVGAGKVPGHLHCETLNERISLEGTRLKIPKELTDFEGWVGVSGFGLSGTNAHVLVGPPPALAEPSAEPVFPALVATSAHHPFALDTVWKRVAEAEHLPSAAAEALIGRGRHKLRRAAVAVGDGLEVLAEGRAESDPAVAFVFSGQGSQLARMGMGLMEEPVFHEAIVQIDALLRTHREGSLLDELLAEEGKLDHTLWTQPALFAVEWALAQWWMHHGVKPTVVMGHSIGEITAAAVAGMLSLEDAVLLVHARSKVLGSLPAGGAMAAIRAQPAEVRAAVQKLEGEGAICIAAINSPTEAVISGDAELVEQIAASFEANEVRVTRLTVSHAFHSPHMEPALPAFREALAGITMHAPTIPLISALDGKLHHGALEPEVWAEHLMAPVLFADAVEAAADECSVFLEIGPRRTLAGPGSRTEPNIPWVGSLHPGADDKVRLLEAAAKLFVHGVDLDAGAFFPGTHAGGEPYPFVRTRHWLDPLTQGGLKSAPLYRMELQPAEPCALAPVKGQWVVVGSAGGLGTSLVQAIRDAGGAAHHSPSLPAEGRNLTVIAVLDEPESDSVEDQWEAGPGRLTAFLREPRVAKLWCVAAGRRPLVEGFVPSATLEHSGRMAGLVRVEGEPEGAEILAAMRRTDGEDNLVVGPSELRVQRLARRLQPVEDPIALDAEATYLITGGLGAVGLSIATMLTDLGARKLVLTSRSGVHADTSPTVTGKLEALRTAGVETSVAAVDCTDLPAMTELVAGLPSLKGVVHAAGVASPATIVDATPEEQLAPLYAKVRGAKVLDLVTAECSLDFFVMLSSIAAVWGSEGLASYGAANASLHALAAKRASEGLPAVAVAYGPWAVGGMVSREELASFRRLGVHPLPADLALTTLAGLIARPFISEVVVADVDWETFVPVLSARRPRLLFERLHRPSAELSMDAAWIRQLRETPATARFGVLRDDVSDVVAAILGVSTSIDPGAGFFDLGLDSVLAVELAERLRTQLGIPLPATVAFDHPSLDQLTAFILAELELSTTVEQVHHTTAHDEPIAIVGLSCRFPGAPDPESFWTLLEDGVDAVVDVPRSRWDADAIYDPEPGTRGKSVSRRGGFLDSVTDFEPDFFGISPREAKALDPAVRLLLEVSWESLETAGIAPDSVTGSATAVFVGIGRSEYWPRLQRPQSEEVGDSYAWSGTGNESSFAAGRIAYHLGTRGPAMAVNTACSSSLVAVHLAAESLRRGEATMALAGGANVLLSPESQIYLSQIRALSPNGRCATFDVGADGYVRGEGCGMLVLKRLSDAERDQDKIFGVIRGSTVGHDGPSSGITVPNGPAQQDVMQRALAQAGVQGSEVAYLEAHGTGTALGDPIEVGAVRAVLGKNRVRPLVMGTVKTQIGHLETAAGVAGLIKVLLAFEKGAVPGNLHYREPNPALPLDFPVRIPTSTSPWPDGRRLAGVSSFGISGTNAHVVVESFGDHLEVPSNPAVHLALLSAHSSEALKAAAHAAKEALKVSDPSDVAATLDRGRARRAYRLAAVGRTSVELRERLRDGRISGQVDPGESGKTLFLFPGQGIEQQAMAAQLFEEEPAFREALEGCLEALSPEDRGRVRTALLEKDAAVSTASLAQPAMVAMGIALAAWWRSVGVVPDRVVGHAAGELAAAAVAGMLSPIQAVWFASERGKLIDALSSSGSMAAIGADRERVAERVNGFDKLSIAAVNHAEETVVSGDTEQLKELLAAFDAAGVPIKRLKHSHALNSTLMGPLLESITALADQLTPSTGTIPLFSTVTGAEVRSVDAQHWATNVRGTVLFRAAVEAAAQGVTAVVELGPHPVLGPLAERSLPDVASLASLRRDRPAPETLLSAAGQLFCLGAPVTLQARYSRRPPVAVGTTPWQRERHWVDAETESSGSDAPLYGLRWVPAPRQGHAPDGTVAVIDDVGGLAEEVLEALQAAGIDAVMVQPSEPLPPVNHVMACNGLDPSDDPREATLHALGALKMVLAMEEPPRLWVITRGAVQFGTRIALDPGQAAVTGMIEVARREHPDLHIGHIDLDPADDTSGVLDALSAGEPTVALLAGSARVPRITGLPSQKGQEIRGDGTYLITGGTGAVGRNVARWLLEKGAGHVVLWSRSEPGELAELGPWSERWSHRAVDVAKREEVQAGIEALEGLAGIFHCAGASDGGLLRTLESGHESLERAWSAKVDGAKHLSELTHSLDCFVLFSSAIAWFGRAGQGAYAAANAWLDGFAQYRRSRGLPGTSIAWGPWAGEGMADGGDFAEAGVRPMVACDALAALEASLGGVASVAVFAADWALFSRRYGNAVPAVLSQLPGMHTRHEKGEASTFVRRLRKASARSADRMLDQAVRTALDEVLGRTGESALPSTRGFFDAGMDSLMAVQLARALGRKFDLQVPPTVAFDHPDLGTLTRYLATELGLHEEQAEPVEGPSRHGGPIAIVGMSCRFPGADSPEAFWELLASGGVPIEPVPADRWDADAWFHPDPKHEGTCYVRSGGFVHGIDLFDPEFFGISPREAASLDPQQRLLMEVSWEALERAGMATDSLRTSRTGVYVGIADRGYLRRFQKPGGSLYPDAYAGTGAEPSFAAGRISHAFGLHGPAVSLNTTCSSALVAVHLGVQALRAGECNLALAGGVHLQLTPDDTAYLCSLGALSPTERCHTFDAAADGYVRSDGCGVFVLKRLADAVAAGDPVLAIIRGSATNHDGPSSGLTVPNGAAQEDVLRRALADAGVSATEVGFLETHGTGTKLGDPIEVRAAMAVYRAGRTTPLRLGAVKANIGHCELAAGAASLAKTVLAMQHRAIPPHPTLKELNPALDLADAEVPTSLTPWDDGTRLAAVSGFGLSGTNAHLVLELPAASDQPSHAAPPASLLALSARSMPALSAAAEQVSGLLEAEEWSSLAPRISASKSPMELRVAVVASDAVEAREKLAAVNDRRPKPVGATPRVAMVFGGQGSQYGGMGLELYAEQAVFRDVIDRCAAVLDAKLSVPLLELLKDGDALKHTANTQPALLAVQLGLAAMWRDWGIEPDAVLGHSLGEFSALVVAGVLSETDALELVVARGALMGALPEGGAMIAVVAPHDRVVEIVGDAVDVAAVNHPEETTLSGDRVAIGEAASLLESAGIEVRHLTVSHAFHSRLLTPMLDEWEERLRSVEWNPPRIPLVSMLTGEVEDEALQDPLFWRRHAAEGVRCADAITTAHELGCTVFLDASVHPVMLGFVRRTIADPSVLGVPSLRRGGGSFREVLDSAGRLFERGVPLNFKGIDAHRLRRGGSLPTTPFDRRRFWLEEPTRGLEEWSYSVHYHPVDAGQSGPSSVLLIGDHGNEWAQALAGAGVACSAMAAPPESFEQDGLPDVIVDLRPLSHEALEDTALGIIDLARRAEGHKVVVVTQEGAPLGTATRPEASAIGGLMRTLALEAPARIPTWVDLDAPVDGPGLLAALSVPEDQVLVRQGGLWVPRLERLPLSPSSVSVEGTWLITGGLGSLGRQVARWLAERGAQRLLLVSRTPLPARGSAEASASPAASRRWEAIEALEALGVDVHTAAVDVVDFDAMAELVADEDLAGVIHAAGITQPQPLQQIDRGTLTATLSAKVKGALVIDELTSELPECSVVFFSSIAAAWGSRDLAAYSAANAFLDGLAQKRHHEGLRGVSVAWGPWADGGMIDEEAAALLQRMGQQLLPPERALAMLGAALTSKQPHVVVARVDWSTYLPLLESTSPRPLLSAFRAVAVEVAHVERPVEEAGPLGFADELMALSESEREEKLTAHLMVRAAEVLRLDGSRPLEVVTQLQDRGFDSLMATELNNALLADGLKVPLGRLLGGPSVEEITIMALAGLEESRLAAPLEVEKKMEETEVSSDSFFIWTHVAAGIVGAGLALALYTLVLQLQ